jgi:secondary thiamine-phosphate synthase enzyme
MESITSAWARRGARQETQPAACATTIQLTTRQPTEFIDITDRVHQAVAEAGICSGLVNVQTLHTTTAIVINEHEPLLLTDFEAILEGAAPVFRRYRHDDCRLRTVNVTADERRNGHAHCRALLLPSSACLNVTHGRIVLGQWQRVFFVELDGPRERQLSVFVLGFGS